MPDSSLDVAHEAKSMASGAHAAVMSLDRLFTHKLDIQEHNSHVIDQRLSNLEKKVEDKFWALAVALIAILIGVCGWFIAFLINNATKLGHG